MSTGLDLVIDNADVVLPFDGVRKLSIGVKDGRTAALGEHGALTGERVIDATGKYVFPGLVDPHLHFGYFNPIESDFRTETAAAATGGVTTVIPFFRHVLGVDVEDDYTESFPRIFAAGDANAHVDFGLHYAFTKEMHLRNVKDYLKLGVTSFKFYLAYKDEEATHYRFVGEGPNDGILFDAMTEYAKLGNVVACIHAENPEVYKRYTKMIRETDRADLTAWSDSRPPIAEAENVNKAFFFGERTGASVYIVHMSSREAIEVTARAKMFNPRAYAETCPHYLTHNVESDLGGILKVTPPVRTREDNEALWEAVKDGTIDTVGSDHTYRAFAVKQGNVWEAHSAFPGTTTILPVLLSEGYRKRGLSLVRISEVTSKTPATIFGLDDRKGDIRVGLDADYAIVDLDWEREVKPEMLNGASDFTIYDGWKMTGWPTMTISRGRIVMDRGEIVGTPGHGMFQAGRY